jgi:hypothetical protein
MKDMEKFKEEVRKLQSLVNADEQGIGMWWGFLDERMQNLFEMYYGFKPSAIKPKVVYYVYCHTCKKLIFKGSIEHAVDVECGEYHNYTFAKKSYFETIYPDIDTKEW